MTGMQNACRRGWRQRFELLLAYIDKSRAVDLISLDIGDIITANIVRLLIQSYYSAEIFRSFYTMRRQVPALVLLCSIA
jgi:hypothetical protein